MRYAILTLSVCIAGACASGGAPSASVPTSDVLLAIPTPDLAPAAWQSVRTAGDTTWRVSQPIERSPSSMRVWTQWETPDFYDPSKPHWIVLSLMDLDCGRQRTRSLVLGMIKNGAATPRQVYSNITWTPFTESNMNHLAYVAMCERLK